MDDFIKYMKSQSGAIIIGSLIVAVSILLSSGIIRLKGVTPLLANLQAPTGTVAQQAAPTQPPAPANADMELGHFPIKGGANAQVAVVEFADMRCPFCKQFQSTTYPQVDNDYIKTNKIKFVFRQYEFLGPASITAGNAIECANEQNKFWEYHDYLYTNQPDESDTSMYVSDKLTDIAKQLGINGDQFKSCLDSTKYAKNITDDLAAGQTAGVSGTPTFIIGKLDSTGKKIIAGQVIVGAVPYAQIKDAIDKALQ
jgi:protein-disulfide isomerase